jgi:hypothetical protein
MCGGLIEVVEALFQAGAPHGDTYASIWGRKDAEKFCKRVLVSFSAGRIGVVTYARRQGQTDEAAADSVGRGIRP